VTGLYRYEVKTSRGRRFELSTVVGPAECQMLVSRFRPLERDGHAHVVFHPPGWYQGGPGGAWVDFYRRRRLQEPGASVHIGYTMFETDRIDPNWATACNGMDEVWVPTEFNRQTFAASGVDPNKLHVVPLGLDIEHYRPDRVRPLQLPGSSAFNFLAVFEWNKRKGYDVLLRAYAAEFTSDDDVTLFVRTYGYASAGRHVQGEQQLREYFLSQCPDPDRAPKIVFLLEKIPDEHMPALYAACDAFVLPTRGEGWGLPFMEAMAMAKPTIATGWSAHTAFMTQENSFLIDTEGLVEVREGDSDYPPDYWGHRMAQPSGDHLRQLMRYVLAHPAEARRRGERARQDVATRWTRANATRRMLDRLDAHRLTPLAGQPNPSDPFRPGLTPFPLNDTRGMTFLHHPRWAETTWRDVVCSYARAFDADDPVTLVLWLDPSQGLSEADAVELVMSALREAGVDPERIPDLLLVPDALDMDGLASLYTATDWVVLNGDAEQLQRALKCRRQVLTHLEPSAWRAAATPRLHESLAA
jgi:glycosyltransferase involved in cell wall biosynthesis